MKIDGRIGHWITWGYVIPATIAIISSASIWHQVNLIRQRTVALNTVTENLKHIHSAALHTQIKSRSVRGYLLDKDRVSLNSYTTSKEAFRDLQLELQDTLEDPEQREIFDKLINQIQQLDTINDELINLIDAGKTEEAINRWRADEAQILAEDISALFEQFDQRQLQLVNALEVSQSASLQILLTVAALSATALVSASLLLNWLISTRISQRLDRAASAIVSSSSQIATTVTEQERTASQQAASVNQTTTTMDELSASARQVMEQAEAATVSAREALEQSESGAQAVDLTLESMLLLKEKVGAIAQQILRLSEQTNQIGNISTLVSDLANQTNMLALNAAVEAVRAGEHGRGFSVVASEIRKLADRSKQSAAQIGNLVADIQTAINSTVMVTEEGTKTVESGVARSQETSNSLANIRGSVDRVVLNNQQIALTIKQQVTAIQQVVEAMSALNSSAQDSAAGISQVKTGTQLLNEAAEELSTLV